jgi:hypothetical protein
MGSISNTVLMDGKHLEDCFNVWETYLNIILMHGKHLGHWFNAQETFETLF